MSHLKGFPPQKIKNQCFFMILHACFMFHENKKFQKLHKISQFLLKILNDLRLSWLPPPNPHYSLNIYENFLIGCEHWLFSKAFILLKFSSINFPMLHKFNNFFWKITLNFRAPLNFKIFFRRPKRTPKLMRASSTKNSWKNYCKIHPLHDNTIEIRQSWISYMILCQSSSQTGIISFCILIAFLN